MILMILTTKDYMNYLLLYKTYKNLARRNRKPISRK